MKLDKTEILQLEKELQELLKFNSGDKYTFKLKIDIEKKITSYICTF